MPSAQVLFWTIALSMAKKKKINSGLTGINALTSCISTTLMLVLLGMVIFFVSFANDFSDNLRENFNVTLILDDEMTVKETRALKKELSQMPAARMVTYISKEKALKEQSEALHSDPSEFMGVNPMPASFEVHLRAAYAHPDSLAKFLPYLKAYPKVLEVSYPQQLLESLNSNIRRISTVLLCIALLLSLVSFTLINNTIQLSVYTHRFLIRTMNLVGASWGFIRRPFMRQAFIIGIISAILATALLGGGLCALVKYEPSLMELISVTTLAYTVGAIFAFGILLTLFCAFVTVNRMLRLKERQLYRY